MASAPTHYLAFDLGASSGRAVVGAFDGERMHMDEVHRFETPIVESDGHIRWDVEALWNELVTGLETATRAAPKLESVSVDSWGVDYVSLNPAGRPVRDPYCYRDPRLDGIMESAHRRVGRDEIYARTGIYFLPFNTLYQLLADRDAGAISEVDCHLTVADYFNYRLSGVKCVEVSMAGTTQMMDVQAKQWDRGLMASFDLDADQWPEIVPSGTVLGRMTDHPDVSVVATCSHDTASAVAAVPATDPELHWAYISCGTWSLMGVERRDPILSPPAWQAGFTNEAGLDGSIRFLKNLTGLWALQECAREWDNVDWERLEREAREAGGPAVLVDLEDPRFLPRGAMEERLLANCEERGQRRPGTRGELVRLILESIANSYRRAVDDLRRVTGDDVDVIHIVGGGSRNRLLCELTAQACGRKVVAGPVEATALGNLLIQARTLGHLPVSIREAAARSSELNVYNP